MQRLLEMHIQAMEWLITGKLLRSRLVTCKRQAETEACRHLDGMVALQKQEKCSRSWTF